MDDAPFADKLPRVDLDEAFPADMVDTIGPALLGESRSTTAALVAAYLLRRVAGAGGTRAKPSAVDHAIGQLERAVLEEARRWCEDEAERIARWCVQAPVAAESPQGDLAVMAAADVDTRVAVIEWAIEHDLDIEAEWYDAAEDRWPRMRATPKKVEFEEEPAVVVKTDLAQFEIPIANLRWLMPVQPREIPRPPMARVLEFPRLGEAEPPPDEQE